MFCKGVGWGQSHEKKYEPKRDWTLVRLLSGLQGSTNERRQLKQICTCALQQFTFYIPVALLLALTRKEG